MYDVLGNEYVYKERARRIDNGGLDMEERRITELSRA